MEKDTRGVARLGMPRELMAYTDTHKKYSREPAPFPLKRFLLRLSAIRIVSRGQTMDVKQRRANIL